MTAGLAVLIIGIFFWFVWVEFDRYIDEWHRKREAQHWLAAQQRARARRRHPSSQFTSDDPDWP